MAAGPLVQKTFLVFGATGQTGRHFLSLALGEGHRVRVLTRNPAKLDATSPNLEIHQGSIMEALDLDRLVEGVDAVVSLLGDRQEQKSRMINTEFVRELVPAMRRSGVLRFLYQAGAFSSPPDRKLSPVLWAIKNTIARDFIGQHKDNEAVMRYLTDEAMDLEWMVHRAAIGSDGPSRGELQQSRNKLSIATFEDCAAYNYRLLLDATAIHTCNLSRYRS